MDISKIVSRSLEVIKDNRKRAEFPVFPVPGKPNWNGQLIDNVDFSRTSRFPGRYAGGHVENQSTGPEPRYANENGMEARVESSFHTGKTGKLEKIDRIRVCGKNQPGNELEIPGKGTDQEYWSADPDALMAFEERAAILEYDGCMPREEAEAMAREEMAGRQMI